MDFFMDNLLYIIIGFVILLIVGYLLQVAFKFAIILGVIALIMIFVFNFSPQEVLQIGNKTKDAVLEQTETIYTSTLEPILEKELKTAQYQLSENGDFIITTTSLQIKGKQNSQTVTILYKDKEYKVSSEPIKRFFENQEEIANPYN